MSKKYNVPQWLVRDYLPGYDKRLREFLGANDHGGDKMQCECNFIQINFREAVKELLAAQRLNCAQAYGEVCKAIGIEECSEVFEAILSAYEPGKEPAGAPETITLAGVEWFTQNETLEGREYFSQLEAIGFAQLRGRRLPTREDLETLSGLPSCWDAALSGRWFAEKQGDLKDPSKSLFLPAVGNRLTAGQTYNVGTDGYYWSATPNTAEWGYYLLFYGSTVSPMGNADYRNGFTVRCVR